MHEADRLDQLEPDRVVTADASGVVSVDVTLPMPSASQLTFTPHAG